MSQGTRANSLTRRAADAVLKFDRLILSVIFPRPKEFLEDRTLWDERYIGIVRGVGALLTIPLVPLLGSRNDVWVYAAIGFALAYDAVILWVLIPRHPEVLRGGYLTFCLDLVAIGMVIYADGGIQSNFYAIYFLTSVIFLFRFPRQWKFFVPATIGLTYSAAVVAAAGLEPTSLGLLAFRLMWIALTAVFAALTVDRAQAAEAALSLELRRTRALLQAAHAPAASLTLSGVLGAVVHHSRMLTESDCAAVLLYSNGDEPTMYREQLDGQEATEAFSDLLQNHSRARHFLLRRAQPVTAEELAAHAPSVPLALDRFSSFCAAPISGPRGQVGFVAVASRSVELNPFHYEALAAFLERAALAIQNARLYEQLQSQMQELRTLHDHIVRAERLAAIGELAAKVAHELNNPLASIHLYNSLLLEEPASPEEQYRLAQNVQEQVERAKRVVKDILDYSRPAQAQLQVTSLNAAVEQGMRFVRHAANAGRVTVVEDYADNLPWVRVDVSRMAQVFTNLTMNAIQAMPRGGKLEISTGLENNSLYVRFRDTGTGISPEDLQRIFDPFYTTKPAGQGTGLGLAVCRTLVNQHHGDITVDSEPGKGSRFTVWLPPAEVKEALLAR